MAARDWRGWALKAAVAVGCALPAVSLGWRLPQAVNPVEFLTRGAGTWALVGLLATLAVSPLRQLSGWAAWLRVRRLLGLSAFAYAVAHFVLYVWLDQGLEAAAIWRDVLKRPFVTVGMAAFVLLLPLAITSTDGWMRRLKRRWGQLHQLVYPAAALAVLHYFWLVKKDLTQPLLYALALAVLLGWRLWRRLFRRPSARQASAFRPGRMSSLPSLAELCMGHVWLSAICLACGLACAVHLLYANIGNVVRDYSRIVELTVICLLIPPHVAFAARPARVVPVSGLLRLQPPGELAYSAGHQYLAGV